MRYSKNLIFTFLIFLSLNVFSQGGWNIGYIVLDSISISQIGEKIKIDFKKENVQKENIKKRILKNAIDFSPIWYIRMMDSVQLKIENENYLIYEVRKIGVDYGYYDDQYLVLENRSNQKKLKVFDSEILTIKNDKILFRFFIGLRKKDAPDNLPNDLIFKDVWIDKKLIDGVMYKK